MQMQASVASGVVLKNVRPWPVTTAAPSPPPPLGSAGTQCTVYPQRIRICNRGLGSTKRLGDWPRLRPKGRSPSEHSLPAEWWSVYSQFVLLLIEGYTS